MKINWFFLIFYIVWGVIFHISFYFNNIYIMVYSGIFTIIMYLGLELDFIKQKITVSKRQKN